MRTNYLLALVALLVALASAWSKEDHEIFRLNDEVKANEGEDVTFYSFIGVKDSSATVSEINKAYRKRSVLLHPDKASASYARTHVKPGAKPDKKVKPGVKVNKRPTEKELAAFAREAEQRFQRLGVVVNILRGAERDRYDHFLKNGFPKWRGTGYYYERMRPGLGSVLFGMFVFGGGLVHYGVLYLSWKRQREFVERYIRYARQMAWGDETGIRGIPGVDNTDGVATPPSQENAEEAMTWNRKEKRARERFERKQAKTPKAIKAAKQAKKEGISTPVEAELTSGPQGAKKRVVAQNGKILIVDSVGNVFLEDTNEEGQMTEYLLDVEEIPQPTFQDTVLIRLPLWAYNSTLGRFLGKTADEPVVGDDELNQDGAMDGEEEAALNSATALNANGESKMRKKTKVRQRVS
ncbi:hypothetical protein K402DRAFT_392496 [Aulographum hederae CBS 113979]|uniref:J domain-containing protein n=1 Tax=Aulographum hederae CBS 113979 TaxID=1176131 RepID=A0A6G1H3R3_9PEZI|nr:hypothetical protein K402DRAFT_392496 [Aulographum hederae CBS 113979]